MRAGNITTAKEKIKTIRFGILKTRERLAKSIPASFLIETQELTDDGYLWCTASGISISGHPTESFPITLKYIRKTEGLFIKVIGRAVICHELIKVRIEEIYCFQKKCTSPYTSFLQSLNTFFDRRQIGHAV